jgi:serine protease
MTELSRPRVIIRFHEGIDSRRYEDAVGYLKECDPAILKRVETAFGAILIEPVFSEKTKGKLPKLQQLAVDRDPSYNPSDLTTFHYVEAENADDLFALAKTLAASPAIRSVDVEIPGPDPLVNDADDPLSVNQTYLDAAPVGLDARYAWTFTGGDGVGQRVIDIEQGWTFNHEDLAGQGITQLNGVLVDTSRAHGTAVLGELCAIDNTLGCTGFAPNIASVFVASRNPSLANSIVDVLDNLDFGDVMLLETQDGVPATVPTMFGPSEIVEAVREACRLATALGIIVVAAGGNGTNNGSAPATNLDTFTNAAGNLVLFRNNANPDFFDSGAIIVAAATSAAPHSRLVFSTHGQRIDCYGWGQNITTCSSDPGGATTLYRNNFGGTSGASPMIAGAALCVQGIYQAATGGRLSPRQMRRILSDPAFNTPRAPGETTAIGVMPNLRGIIDNVLGFVPDVYIRDNVADNGDPHNGAISASPDIILRPVTVADPQASFGEGSGSENNSSLGFEAEAGQDNFLYVRVRNRGGAAANNVNADLFWSPPSTLVTPDLWTFIGSTTIASVLTGNQLTVSNSVTWPSAAIPAPGHYCFVGLIGTVNDPAPAPADFLNFDNFRTFIRANNNVTWRNFNVVNNDPGDPEAQIALNWLMPGAPDKARRFALHLRLDLPRRAELLLDLPVAMLRALEAQVELVKIDHRRGRAIAKLPPIGDVRFGPGLIDSKARYEMKFLVRLNSKKRGKYSIVARQLYEGNEEVGRLSWLFDPNRRMAREGLVG